MKVICSHSKDKYCKNKKCQHHKPHNPLKCGFGGKECSNGETPCDYLSDCGHYEGFHCVLAKAKKRKEPKLDIKQNSIDDPIKIVTEWSQDIDTIRSGGTTWWCSSTCDDGIVRGGYHPFRYMPCHIQKLINKIRKSRAMKNTPSSTSPPVCPENESSPFPKLSKCRIDATKMLEDADRQLGEVFVKTCQMKNKNIRVLVNECIKEAQFQIDDAIAYMDRGTQ